MQIEIISEGERSWGFMMSKFFHNDSGVGIRASGLSVIATVAVVVVPVIVVVPEYRW